MTELDIRKEIGRRIFEARKEKGLTQKALGDLAGNLKQTRLTNWEQGLRTPGLEEIKQLAEALEESPAFLMCLSDEKENKKSRNHSRLIPLLDHHQACDAKSHTHAIRQNHSFNDMTFISVSTALLPELSKEAFALKMMDESMTPEIRVNDVLVIDPSISPKPGDFVVVKLANQQEAIVCQFKKLSYTSPEFELITLNDNWPNIKVTDGLEMEIVGRVVQRICKY